MARTRPPFGEKPTTEALDKITRELRLDLVAISHRSKTSLSGGALSCLELLASLYWNCLRVEPKNPDNPDRDRFILDKGHAIVSLYATIAHRGFFPKEELEHYGQEGSRLSQQPAPGSVPGIEWSAGSPGRGLGIGLGMALAARIQRRSYNVYVLLHDGESQENSAGEAALLAAQLNLSNLTAIVEYHGQQTPGQKNTAANSPASKWQALGWATREVDGNDLNAIAKALRVQRSASSPIAILARTVAGKGVSFVEADKYEPRVPSDEEVESTRRELGL